MTVKSIAEQINAIREATQKAAASPETALDFLRRAGIVGAGNLTAKTNSEQRNRVAKIMALPSKQV